MWSRMKMHTENKEKLLEFYRDMKLIRRFEEKAAQLYTQAYIGGYCHLNIGEEATIVGAFSPLREDDYVVSYYREHGHAIALGTDPGAIMAELLGKDTGISKGRGGSMHLFDPEHRLWGGYGIVGGQIPLAVGMAMAVQYRQQDKVVMCVLGEGATNIGAFHESMNMAKIYNLPLLFFCINNQYAMGSTVNEASAVPLMTTKAQAYDMPAEQVDGMDLLAVRDVTQRHIEQVRETSEPHFIEAITYRFRGHSMADAARYRTQEELRQWQQRDPINTYANFLHDENVLTPELRDQIDASVEEEIERVTQFAMDSPEPDVKSLYDYVYAEDGQ